MRPRHCVDARFAVATNTARDLGARLGAMTIWGTKASGGSYAAIAALTNIPATLLAAAFHEFILSDSSRGALRVHVRFLAAYLPPPRSRHAQPRRLPRRASRARRAQRSRDTGCASQQGLALAYLVRHCIWGPQGSG